VKNSTAATINPIATSPTITGAIQRLPPPESVEVNVFGPIGEGGRSRTGSAVDECVPAGSRCGYPPGGVGAGGRGWNGR
jgi:hypothetical protein